MCIYNHHIINMRIYNHHLIYILHTNQQQEEELAQAQDNRLSQLTEKINNMIEETEKLGCEGQVSGILVDN